MIAEDFCFNAFLPRVQYVFNNATLDEFLHFYVTSGNGILQLPIRSLLKPGAIKCKCLLVLSNVVGYPTYRLLEVLNVVRRSSLLPSSRCSFSSIVLNIFLQH